MSWVKRRPRSAGIAVLAARPGKAAKSGRTADKATGHHWFVEASPAPRAVLALRPNSAAALAIALRASTRVPGHLYTDGRSRAWNYWTSTQVPPGCCFSVRAGYLRSTCIPAALCKASEDSEKSRPDCFL